ncbi:helix-turn-helix domain-containing protein [Methanospirillum stamsii]|uniref:HTH bat-type domain-containing protein n=2 Tax=Methanospirillum stamsii TaxID=1277351 RepID=A0A2V2NFI0_9EURY|nr:hypothetical protein DLD82_00470 [Methanospirillum stamsii]
MRKMIVECQLSGIVRRFYNKKFFEVVKSVELIRIIRLDVEKGTKLGIAKFICNPGYSLNDIEFPPGADILSVFQESGEESILLFRGTAPSSYQYFSGFLLHEIIWTTPTILTNDRIIYSVIGDEKSLNHMLRLTKTLLGEIRDISYEKATFGPYDLMQTLTKKQQEVIMLAKKQGYYQNPRKITLEDISRLSGLSKATVAEHLRKAENRIMNSLLAGYS